jgi:serine/threonine protein kinase
MVSADKGTTIEQYELEKPLGDGQFGVGWLAKDTESNQKVCVKVFKEMDEDSEKTFRAEVSAAQAGLSGHENIL